MTHNIDSKNAIYRLVISMAFLLVLAGSGTLVKSLFDYSKGTLSSDWPFVVGQIIESRISTSSTRNASGSVTSSNHSISHKPVIVYQYVVDGKKIINNTIKFGGVGGSNRQLSSQYVNQYPLGHQVNVYYSPNHPDNSVLVQGVAKTNIWAIVGSLVFILFGLNMYRQRYIYVQSVPDQVKE